MPYKAHKNTKKPIIDTGMLYNLMYPNTRLKRRIDEGKVKRDKDVKMKEEFLFVKSPL